MNYVHENIDRLYRCADPVEKLIIGGGVFALKYVGLTE